MPRYIIQFTRLPEQEIPDDIQGRYAQREFLIAAAHKHVQNHEKKLRDFLNTLEENTSPTQLRLSKFAAVIDCDESVVIAIQEANFDFIKSIIPDQSISIPEQQPSDALKK